jgi:hypothetical protein
MACPGFTPRVFASKPFMRFARRFGISNAELWQAVTGDYDADLGGGVFKFRLARAGEGTRGGARAIVAMKVGLRVVLMFGFEKKDMANIKADELRIFRKAAHAYFNYSEEEMTAIVRKKSLSEIVEPNIKRGENRGKDI